MNEARLHELARKLGAGAAERLDVDATARRVVERLREQPAARTIWGGGRNWLRIAAAVAVLVGGIGLIQVSWDDPGTHVAHLVVDDLHDLSTEELRDVLASLDTLLNDAAVSDSAADLHELDAQQLRAMLRSLEG